MAHKNTKLTTLEPQTFYRVVLLIRYTSEKRNQLGRHPKFNAYMDTYVSGGNAYYYQDFELWGPYLSPNVAEREAKSAGSYESVIYSDDYDVIIEAVTPVWDKVETRLDIVQ